MILLELLSQFMLISLVAFGGGQGVLPLVERVAVTEHHWITSSMFSTAVAFSYVTPGPVLIVATFIGYQSAGFWGALAATIGAFLLPFLFAALAARQFQRIGETSWLKAFSQGAAPAVIGLLGLTIVSLGQTAFTHIGYVGLAIAAIVLSMTKLHPALIILMGMLGGLWLGHWTS